MDQLPPLGKAIVDVIMPTFQIYAPLLQKNADTIKSVKKETFDYGPHERQKLDVYSPSKPSIINGRKPVLMFEYGGGLVNGARTLPPFPEQTAYANVAAFYALKYGYTVVIADYRLVNQHDARFPSGGEDIALAVEWIAKNQVGPGEEPIDLFIMGNSAGGVHLSTFLLHEDFAETRKKVTTGGATRLRGAVMLSVPFSFGDAHDYRRQILETYFGDWNTNCPLGLLRSARQRGAPFDFVKAGIRVFVLNNELDPEDEILEPRDEFLEEWMQMRDLDSRAALAVDMTPGHNHISSAVSLSTGDEKEEAWGHQVAAFCDSIRKFAPKK